MFRRHATVALMLLALTGASTPALASVSVDIGIHLPGPPVLVPIPGLGVTYAPAAPANYFFHGGRYWVFTGGVWYASAGYDGPWAVVAPEFVPAPILAVPVRYYRVRPPEWRAWPREAPPRWHERWARHRPPERGEHRAEGHRRER